LGKRKLVASKLNALDSRIIKELLQDGRATFVEIANRCGVTKNKVWKRFMAMARKGIISGATIQMNFAKFGYEVIATFLINVEAHQIEQVMAYIRSITEVFAFRQYNSVYNIRAFATLKDLDELDRLKQAIKRKLPTVGIRTYIWTDVRNVPENLGLTDQTEEASGKAKPNLSPLDQKQTDTVKIDELDLRIVKLLTLDGRASFTKIAQEVGTSVDTVMKRYRKLRKSNAVKVTIQINPNKLGYTSILDFSISFSSAQDLSSSVVESLAKIPDVIIITKISGEHDLQVTAMIRDVQRSLAIQDEIARINGITKMEVSARKLPAKWPTPQQYISTM
jgi:DNA-binding Lrp family transcriptional regulator